MVYVDLPGTPECPEIPKDLELSKSKNSLESPRGRNENNEKALKDMNAEDLNDNKNSEIPGIFAIGKNGERTKHDNSWNCPENLNSEDLSERETKDSCPNEKFRILESKISESNSLTVNESSTILNRTKARKDIENNTISSRSLMDDNVVSYATEKFASDDCEIEIVPEFTALDNEASPQHRSRSTHSPKNTTETEIVPESPALDNEGSPKYRSRSNNSPKSTRETGIVPEFTALDNEGSPQYRSRSNNSPKCTNKVTLNLPIGKEVSENRENLPQKTLSNVETSATQHQSSVLESPVSVSDYLDRIGESNDTNTLPHCFFGGFDITKDSNFLQDFPSFPFDEDDFNTTIIVQEGEDDDDSVIILHTEQTSSRPGGSENPPNIVWNEPRVLSSLSDVSLIDVEDSSLWKDCALLKDYSPSIECSPFQDFASLNDFNLMGDNSPSPLQTVSPLENYSLASTRDNSPSRETNSVRQISLPASPEQELPPPLDREVPEISTPQPLEVTSDSTENSCLGYVPPSIPVTDDSPQDNVSLSETTLEHSHHVNNSPTKLPPEHSYKGNTSTTKQPPAQDPQDSNSATEQSLDNGKKSLESYKTSLISTKLTQDTIPTDSPITTKASLDPATTTSPANDSTSEPHIAEESSPEEASTPQPGTDEDIFPFGTENKSRGILTSCQVPKGVAEIPEALLNLKDPNLKSPMKNSKNLKSKLLSPDCKGNSWRDFKIDPSDIVSSLTEPYLERPKSRSKNTKPESRPSSRQNCSGIKESQEGEKENQRTKNDIGDSFGPKFFADLCSLWPDIIVRLAHDISLESPSVEDAPDPPDPPSLSESDRRESCDGEEGSLQSPRPQPTSPRPQPEGKCCSDEDPCCPQLMAEHTSELRAASSAVAAAAAASSSSSVGSPKRQVLLSGPCLSAGLQPASCPSPICGSPAPRRPRPMSSSGPSSVESVDSTDTGGDASMTEFFSGDLEDLLEATTPPDGDLDGAGRSSGSWDQKPNERKRRKLPEIPKNKKSFSTASILALRSGPTLAEELHEAESGVASRSSTPDALTLINNHSRPILVLKCHSYIRDDNSSPDSELRLPLNDIDSGNSTQHSPDGAKSMSPQATVNESLSPMSPGSGGVPFPQLELLEATHRGLYRFIPRHHDEVDIEIGDPIYVQKEADDLWCEGVNLRTGRQGIFPGAHVTDVDYSDFDPSVPKVKKERYLLNYLGSIETLCHKGNQVLCQAVRKIAGGEESVQHPHPCILEVSDQGIRMVDKSKPGPNHVPCHDYFYHLKHVSFCAFHPKDHRYFGFITKHPTIQRFACHVFRSNDSTRPVAEAVGRAFQRFYQKFIETAYPIEDIYLE